MILDWGNPDDVLAKLGTLNVQLTDRLTGEEITHVRYLDTDTGELRRFKTVGNGGFEVEWNDTGKCFVPVLIAEIRMVKITCSSDECDIPLVVNAQ